jgi:hypothetical protein
MFQSFPFRALFPLALAACLAALPTAGCGLDHCPRPKLLPKEGPSVAWSLEHTRLGQEASSVRYTQSSFHPRFPLGTRWSLGGHLPFGYLQIGGFGTWGLANPMVYAERTARPWAWQAITLGVEAALGLRVARTFFLKPRWKQQLMHPGRFAWSTGVDVKFDVPVY